MAGGRAGGGQSVSGRPLCNPCSSRPTDSARPSQHRPHPRAGPLPGSWDRRCAREATRPPSTNPGHRRREVPLPGGFPAPEAHVHRGAEEADSRALPGRRRRARAPPGGRDFDFKERKEGRETTPSFPSCPPDPAAGPGHAQEGGGGPAEGTFLSAGQRGARTVSLLRPVHGSCKPSRRPEAQHRNSFPRLEEPPVSPGPWACPAPPPPPLRALRLRRWMA